MCLAGSLKAVRHPAAAQLLEDVVLVFQLIPHEVELRDLGLPLAHGADRGRGRQVQPARAAELACVVVLGAAAGAVHPFSGEAVCKLRTRRSGCQLISVASALAATPGPD